MGYSHLVALGAIVTILSVAIEPAFQALISDKGSLDSTSIIATVNRADNFDGGTQCVDQTERESFTRCKPSKPC